LRIENAATPEMEMYIEDLRDQLIYEIIPRYFSSQELKKIEKLQLLNPEHSLTGSYNGLMKEALQVISSLQALITVIENVRYRDIQQYHRNLFKRNVNNLDKYGFSFPLTIDQFSREKCQVNMYYNSDLNYSYAVN
jgi:hypothetical protein